MNYEYIIEDKYNLGVGLVNIESTQKLLKHFEFIEWNDREYTLDIYENGLIKCNQIIKICAGNGSQCFYVDESNPSSRMTIFNINITDGDKLENIYLKLIEDIYRPLCEKNISPAPNCYNKVNLLYYIGSGLNSNDYRYRGILLKETFETLKTIKTLYDTNKIKIFKTPKKYVKLENETQNVSHHKDYKLFESKATERFTKSTHKKKTRENKSINFQDIIIREAWK